jgi:hypothetical protein
VTALFGAKNVWRGGEDGDSRGELGTSGEYAHLNLQNGQRISLPWDKWASLLGRYSGLETRRKRVETMKAPAMPQKRPAAASGAGNQSQEALDWARANPEDPRSAKILEVLGL